MIRTFIVDDEPDLRLLLRLAIEQRNEGLLVVGEAAAGPEALHRLAGANPAVVVLDQMMPGIDGLETARRMLAVRPDLAIILYSAYLDEDLQRAAAAIGVAACMRKGRARDLADLVHQVAAGQNAS